MLEIISKILTSLVKNKTNFTLIVKFTKTPKMIGSYNECSENK